MAIRDSRKIKAILSDPKSGLVDKVARSLVDYTVALFALKGSPQKLKLGGTGTLVAFGGNHFILTARHVWDETLKTADLIGITMKPGITHRTVLNRSAVTAIGLPPPGDWDEWGPDLVLLSMPKEDVGRITAVKSFWTLDQRVEINASVLEQNVLVGTPEETGTITDIHADLLMHGMFLAAEKLTKRDGLDYLDYDMNLGQRVQLIGPSFPKNFGGVSGGGVWRVFLYWEPARDEIDWKMSLHGVAFWQFPPAGERNVIRCHGPESIAATLRLLNSKSS